MYAFYESPFADELLEARSRFQRATTQEVYGHKKRLQCLAWNHTGSALATGSHDHGIRIWKNIATLKDSTEYSGHTDSVSVVAWNPQDERVFASTSSDKTIKVWDTRSPRETRSIASRGEGLNLIWSPDGKTILCGCKISQGGDALQIADVAENRISKIVKFPYIVNEMAWNASGSHFFLTTGNGSIEIRGWPDFKLARSISAHSSTIFSLAVSPNGQHFAVGGADALVSIWDMNELVSQRTLGDHSSMLRSLSISADSKFIASGSEDSRIFLSHIGSGATVATIPTAGPCSDLAWHPTRNLLAFASSGPLDRHAKPSLTLYDATRT